MVSFIGGENHRPAASHWQTVLNAHIVSVLITPPPPPKKKNWLKGQSIWTEIKDSKKTSLQEYPHTILSSTIYWCQNITKCYLEGIVTIPSRVSVAWCEKYIGCSFCIKEVIKTHYWTNEHKTSQEEFENTKGVIRICKSGNTMAKRKSTKNDLQNTTQKTKDRAIQTQLKTRSDLGAPEQ